MYMKNFPTRTPEEFSLFMWESDNGEEKQKQLLINLLENNSNAEPWHDYILHVQKLNTGSSGTRGKTKKAQLLKLLGVALECIDEVRHKDDKYFLMLQKVTIRISILFNWKHFIDTN